MSGNLPKIHQYEKPIYLHLLANYIIFVYQTCKPTDKVANQVANQLKKIKISN